MSGRSPDEKDDRKTLANAIQLGSSATVVAGTAAGGAGNADTLRSGPDMVGADAFVGDTAAIPLDDAQARYQRQSVLGEGGMGKVWLTRDERIGRRVALKEIREDEGDLATRAMFLREARVQGQLEHPAVVPVYDLGRSEDGKLFFTMKRVRGVTLAEVIEAKRTGEGPLGQRFSLRRLLTAYSQICLAVEFAHDRGVIHRDLKPENLMLGDHGEVYVLDWGVARVLRDDLDADPVEVGAQSVVAAGIARSDAGKTGLVGTPGYIAPEQFNGAAVGPAADVFALGAILFELLVHQPLFGTGNPLLRIQRTLEGIDVGALVARLDRESPPELVSLCARATAAEVSARVGSARELHDAIDAYLDGERDQQLRRELAESHLAESRRAMLLSVDDVDAHKRALRETGRALALVPDHPEARAIILSLFASSPKAVPPEVDAAIEIERAEQARITARGGTAGMASMLLFLPVLVLLGIRSWLGIGVFFAMVICAVGISVVAARKASRSEGLLYGVVVFNNLVFALCSGLYGPLILVPSMVITNTISFVLHLDGRARLLAIVSGCLAVLLPVVLPLVTPMPSAYLPSGDGILVRPLWLALPPIGTAIFVTLGTLIAVVNGSLAVGRVRDSLTLAERRLQMQRWQLQQLLPEERD